LYVEPRQSSHQGGEDMASADNDDDDLDEKEEDKEEKKTLKARLQAIQVSISTTSYEQLFHAIVFHVQFDSVIFVNGFCHKS
jgi:hypothetical protein